MQGKASGNDGRRSNTDSPRRARRAADDSAELFVDPAPSTMRAERPKQHITAPPAPAAPARAADRRREKGRAPEPVEAKDTRTSLQQHARRTATVASYNGNLEGGVCGAIACVRGPEAGTVLSLAPGSYTVGRARENDLVLKDIAASRKHLRLEVSKQAARLVDLGSGNGTKVNGKRAGEVELRHGDTIEIGGSVLVFSASGQTATVAADGPLDEAQARVVAAADVLARELSDKLRFGDENASEAVDGHRAQTRALKSADARAVAEELARRQADRASVPPAPVEPAKRGNDRLWNETFTNVPLSAVVPDEQRLQGTARDLPRRPTRAETPEPRAAFSISPLPTGPAGTAAEDSRFAPEATAAAPRGPSFVSSVLLSAAVVIAVGTLGLAAWAIFFRDDDTAAVTTDAPSAEYATAITRAQDAFAAKDWAKMRDYAEAALQVRPHDQMAASYKRDAELRLEAETAPAPAAPAPVTPPTPTPALRQKPAAPVAETAPAPAPAPAPVPAAVRVTLPVAAAPERAPTPKPNRKPSRRALSDDEARSRFERAIDAFRSKDTDTGCQLLEQVAERAPVESAWRGKADTLFLKRCGG